MLISHFIVDFPFLLALLRSWYDWKITNVTLFALIGKIERTVGMAAADMGEVEAVTIEIIVVEETEAMVRKVVAGLVVVVVVVMILGSTSHHSNIQVLLIIKLIGKCYVPF